MCKLSVRMRDGEHQQVEQEESNYHAARAIKPKSKFFESFLQPIQGLLVIPKV